MIPQCTKVRTWWVNRALLYWIPGVAACLVTEEMLSGNYGGVTNALGFIVVFTLFIEQIAFGYKVDMLPGELHYSQGLFLRRRIALSRDDIQHAEFLPLTGLSDARSARLAVTKRDGEEVVLSLAAFRPADVAKIVDWLPVKPQRP